MTTSKKDRPVAVDLFAGAGGLALGFEQAGFDVAVAVEFDPVHAATHEMNFPDAAVICNDVRNVTGAEIRRAGGLGQRPIDVVVGGPPCQGFSLIGHRVLDDPRNSLVFHFLRIVTELKPRTFVMENVPGMATGAHGQFLRELIQKFEEAGYRVRSPYRTLNARFYGVPQDRERLFLLGSRRDTPVPEYPAPITRPRNARSRVIGASNLELDLDGLPFCPSVEDAVGDLPEIEDYPELIESDVLRVKLAKRASAYARRLRGDAVDEGDYSYPRLREAGRLTGCLRASHTDLSRERFAATPPGATEPISRFFRLANNGTCNTLRAGTASERGAFTAPRPIHPASPRCISVREAARLHSYPDWFRFHRTIWHGFRQIGNSVPPMLGRAVGGSIMRALDVTPAKPARTVALGPEDLAKFTMKEAAAHFGVSHTVIAPRKRAATG
jgi:DNA (cytosine-5)-methyltransferase 1